ncbi:hypothetical protein B8W85_13095, partial [Lentilactobacillus kefiri]
MPQASPSRSPFAPDFSGVKTRAASVARGVMGVRHLRHGREAGMSKTEIPESFPSDPNEVFNLAVDGMGGDG